MDVWELEMQLLCERKLIYCVRGADRGALLTPAGEMVT